MSERKSEMRGTLGLGFTVTVMLLVGHPLSAGQETIYTDGELRDMLRADLVHLAIDGLEVRVLGRMVTLKGTVESLARKTEAEALVRRRPGIGEVFDELEVVKVEDDAELKRQILTELQNGRHYSVYDEVSLSVSNGVVTLEGRVPQDSDTKGLMEEVSKIRGVRAIQNEIRVLPYSPSDEKLQEAVAIDVYAALEARGRPTSLVHVVVENARVTLTGVVDDESTRKAAEEAARRTEGVLSVENRLEVAGEPHPLSLIR